MKQNRVASIIMIFCVLSSFLVSCEFAPFFGKDVSQTETAVAMGVQVENARLTKIAAARITPSLTPSPAPTATNTPVPFWTNVKDCRPGVRVADPTGDSPITEFDISGSEMNIDVEKSLMEINLYLNNSTGQLPVNRPGANLFEWSLNVMVDGDGDSATGKHGYENFGIDFVMSAVFKGDGLLLSMFLDQIFADWRMLGGENMEEMNSGFTPSIRFNDLKNMLILSFFFGDGLPLSPNAAYFVEFRDGVNNAGEDICKPPLAK